MASARIHSTFTPAALLASAAWASQENASVFKIGTDVTIEAGTRVKRVVALGGQVTVNGTVDGDVVAVGASVVLGKRALVVTGRDQDRALSLLTLLREHGLGVPQVTEVMHELVARGLPVETIAVTVDEGVEEAWKILNS